ncbi:MAG: DNA-binding protein, partial [Ilumatobacteraceae bacterium]
GIRDKGWRLGLLINGVGAIVTGVVTIVIGVTKFSHGAWFIMILVPAIVAGLVKLNHQYERETKDLSHDVRQAIESRVMNRLVALVLVGNLDRSVAAGLQYARSIRPDDLRAVHVAVDPNQADELCTQWLDLNFTKIPLDLINCPDRRLERAVVDLVQRELANGDTEVSIIIPRLHHNRWWHRMLHDRTGNSIASELAGVKNANVTFVPFVIGGQQK